MILFVWSKTFTKGILQNFRITANIEGSYGALRSATITTKNGVYRRLAVKFATVIPIDKDVCTNENSAGDVEAEPSQQA